MRNVLEYHDPVLQDGKAETGGVEMLCSRSLDPLVDGLEERAGSSLDFFPPRSNFPCRAPRSVDSICQGGPCQQWHPTSLALVQRTAFPLRTEGILLLSAPSAIFHLGRF